MDDKRDDVESSKAEVPPYSGPIRTRRTLLAGAAGFVLGIGGLLVPVWLDEAEAREGALGGAKGGRRGKNHRGRHKQRTHGDNKDKDRDDAPRGNAPFGLRSSALTVVNHNVREPLQCTFFYRTKTGLDSYDLPTADGTQTINHQESYRYDPDRFRVGVLIKAASFSDFDLYADVRNVSYWFPRGGVTRGSNLDPAGGNFGATFIREQDFSEREWVENYGITLRRGNDSGRIEWRLVF